MMNDVTRVQLLSLVVKAFEKQNSTEATIQLRRVRSATAALSVEEARVIISASAGRQTSDLTVDLACQRVPAKNSG